MLEQAGRAPALNALLRRRLRTMRETRPCGYVPGLGCARSPLGGAWDALRGWEADAVAALDERTGHRPNMLCTLGSSVVCAVSVILGSPARAWLPGISCVRQSPCPLVLRNGGFVVGGAAAEQRRPRVTGSRGVSGGPQAGRSSTLRVF